MTVAIDLATGGDDAGVRRLVRTQAMPGRVRLSFCREPDFSTGCAVTGDEYRILVARSVPDGSVVGVACRAARRVFLNGLEQRIGYLGQLRVDERYRGRWLVSRGFAMLEAMHRADPLPAYLASIVDGNDDAAGILVRKPRRGFPRFREVARIVTLAVRVRRAARGARPTCDDTAPPIAEVAEFLQREGLRRQLSSVWTGEALERLASYGLTSENIRVARRNGAIAGVVALWDQSAYSSRSSAATRDGCVPRRRCCRVPERRSEARTPRSSRLPTTTRSCSTRCCATSAHGRPHAGSITCSWGSTCATRSWTSRARIRTSRIPAACTWLRGRTETSVMNGSMIVPRTSTSRRSDAPSRLAGTMVPVAAVTLSERHEMYALLRSYFVGTTRGRFESDLREKEAVILLRDEASGQVRGFSTFTRMAPLANVVAFFSGDTISRSRVLGGNRPDPHLGFDGIRGGGAHCRVRCGRVGVLVPHLVRIQDVALPPAVLPRVLPEHGRADAAARAPGFSTRSASSASATSTSPTSASSASGIRRHSGAASRRSRKSACAIRVLRSLRA